MSALLAILGAIGDFTQWVIGFGQRRIGREEQENADARDTIAQLEREKDAAVSRPDALSELSKHEL
jgi:hypothetical protein